MGLMKDKFYALAEDFAFGDDGFNKIDGERVFFSKNVKLLVGDSYEKRRLRITNYRVSFATGVSSKNYKINRLGNISTKRGFFCKKATLQLDDNKEVKFKLSKRKYKKLGKAFVKAFEYYGVELVIGRNDIVLDVAVDTLNKLPGLVSKAVTATKVGIKIAQDEKTRGIIKTVGGAILNKIIK